MDDSPIEVKQSRCGGRPTLRGTRIGIWILEDYIEHYDKPAQRFCEEYPNVDSTVVENAIEIID